MTLDDDNANLTLPPSRPSPGSWYVRLSSQHLIGPNLPWPPLHGRRVRFLSQAVPFSMVMAPSVRSVGVDRFSGSCRPDWGHVFACLLWIVVIHLLWAWGYLLPRLRACRKGTIGSL